MNLIIATLIFALNSFASFAKSEFLESCKDAKDTSNTISSQIIWLKKVLKTNRCESIQSKLKEFNSLNEFIPTLYRSPKENRIFKPQELRPGKFSIYDLDSASITKEAFTTLKLFREFRNLKHIRYTFLEAEKRSVCETLEQIPSLTAITVTDWNLSHSDIECIKNRKIEVYIDRNFTPNDRSEIFKDQIYGINNYLGNVNELHTYKKLKYLGLEEYQEETEIKILPQMRNLTHLHLNLKNIKGVENISKLNTLLYLSIGCYKTNHQRNQTLKSLACDENKFSNLNFLKNLKFLKGLDISWNEIENIEAIQNLRSLEYLSLRMNKIKSIKPIEILKKLKFLDLANNAIEDISPLRQLSQLKFLNIGNNKISDIKTLSSLKSIKYLSLGNNPIKNFEVFDPSPTLELLNLNPNLFQYNLDPTLITSNILKSLEDNNETSWAENLFFEDPFKLISTENTNYEDEFLIDPDKLVNLKALSVSNIKFTKAPHIGNLKSLIYLDASNTNLQKFEINDLTPKGIKLLNLKNSSLERLPSLSNYKNLEYFDASFNDLSIYGTINSETIQVIRLNNCKLEIVPTFGKTPRLMNLDLSNNLLKYFNFPTSSKLTVLNLNNNQIEVIPKIPEDINNVSLNLDENKIKTFENLEFAIDNNNSIYLKNNLIEDLTLFQMSYYEKVILELEGNPVKACPQNTTNPSVSMFCKKS